MNDDATPVWIAKDGKNFEYNHGWAGLLEEARAHVVDLVLGMRENHPKVKVKLGEELIRPVKKEMRAYLNKKIRLSDPKIIWKEVLDETEPIGEEEMATATKKKPGKKFTAKKKRPSGPSIQDLVFAKMEANSKITRKAMLSLILKRRPRSKMKISTLSWYVAKFNAGELTGQKKKPKNLFQFSDMKKK